MLLLQRRRHHHRQVTTAGAQEADFFNLNASYDLVQVVAYDPPPQLIQQCLRYLIAQVISDPTLHSQVMAIASGQQQQQQRAGETPGSSSSVVQLLSSSSLSSSSWILTSSMTALQQPFYNIIRTNLRYAAIHSSESPFFSALSLWLLWLEPWNVKECKWCVVVRMHQSCFCLFVNHKHHILNILLLFVRFSRQGAIQLFSQRRNAATHGICCFGPTAAATSTTSTSIATKTRPTQA
jgi:hypothetical protein